MVLVVAALALLVVGCSVAYVKHALFAMLSAALLAVAVAAAANRRPPWLVVTVMLAGGQRLQLSALATCFPGSFKQRNCA